MCSAYQNANGKWVIVAINYSEDVKPVNFQLDNHEQKNWHVTNNINIAINHISRFER